MIGTETTTEAPLSTTEMQRLQRSFELVDRLARQLEDAYSRLNTRAPSEESDESEEVKQLRAEFDGLLDAIPCGVVTAAADGTITRVNSGAECVLGRPEHELVGRDVRTLLDHRAQPILLLGKDGVPVGATVERLTSTLDGSTRHLSGCVAEIPGGGRLEILADQTEVAHLRHQVHRLDTLAAMGEMAAGIAHEIRNPMSGVEGFAGLLEKCIDADGPTDEEVLRRYTNRIRRGVAEVNNIITSLLMWARPERAVREQVEVLPLLNEVIDDLGERDGEAGFGLDVRAPEAALEGDRLKLKLAFTNVVKNAREAAGAEGSVLVTLEAAERGVSITVQDSGPGLSPEVAQRLFQPFTTNKAGGTGLGLALTRKFLELHGGTIAVDRGGLGGACFRLVLPSGAVRGEVQ